jgi:hypothetical protein
MHGFLLALAFVVFLYAPVAVGTRRAITKSSAPL